MRRSYFLAALLLTSLCAGARAQGPTSFMAVHCEPTNAHPLNFLALRGLVAEADQRKVVLTIQASPPWAEMILADASMLAELRGWQLAGHEVAGHHHPVDGPVTWDGYTDLEPGSFTDPVPYQGTMTDYKLLLDDLVGGEGMQVGAIPSHDYEWPYGALYKTGGDDTVVLAVSQPEFEISNKYGLWSLDYAALSSISQLQHLKQEHAGAATDEVVGAITHVFNYQDTPQLIQAWFDYLVGADPSGARNLTVGEIMGAQPLPLAADVESISASAGGSVALSLFSEASLAGDTVLFLISLSGSAPGYAFGGVYDPGVRIGVNVDSLTLLALNQVNQPWCQGFLGSLDAAGGASASFHAPASLPPSLVGSSLNFTAIASASAFAQIDFSANPVAVAIAP